MENEAALDEVIKFDSLSVCSVEFPNEQRVDSGTQIVTKRGESILKLFVVDTSRMISKDYLC